MILSSSMERSLRMLSSASSESSENRFERMLVSRYASIDQVERSENSIACYCALLASIDGVLRAADLPSSIRVIIYLGMWRSVAGVHRNYVA